MKRLPLLLAVLAVALAGLGAHFVVRGEALRGSESARDRAFVDVDATAEVRSAVTRAVNRVLSYSSDDLGATERAAEELLTGRAGREYGELVTVLHDRAAEQRLTVATNVTDAAVLSLTDDTARVLVFADQTSRRADGDPTTTPLQLVVTTHKPDRTWLITHLQVH
ncbi:hypothetical protein [Saccharomonospora iraqiensis]|uniref:hypothetical protein n=1 Tax=Saccharomonospora iraqiensis TaxID=52698 RepID=UPI00022E1958|nr:hypothetical protein [Saccharomonospora iraqiensis]